MTLVAIMGFNRCATTLFVLSLLIAFLSRSGTEGAATYLSHYCPGGLSFTANSTYQSNLNHLLASLTSNATRPTGFYNTTASSPNSVDTVYGLFLCRGDISSDDCRDCVSGATEDLAERCPKAKEAMAWYEYCMLRYKNQYFFSSMVTDPDIYMWNATNISDPSRFDQLVRTTMNDLSSGVSNLGSGAKKFGTKEANFTALQTLYTLTQCTPDLSGSDCNICLQRAIASLPGCCGGKQGGRILYPSCNVRFEVYPFYTVNTSAPTASTPATYLSHYCQNALSFTANSTYQSNLNHLLASLTSNATRPTGFYNTTASSPNSVDTVFGLFLCRGDVSSNECRDCISGATEDVAERCPKEKDAVAWYEYCMLRYANQYFFSSMVTDPGIYMWNEINISDPSRFDQLVRTTMNDLASEISKVGSGAKKFGTKEANFTSLQTLHTLAQCTPDLSDSDCSSCLQRAIASLPGCCGGKQGARVLFPSCNVRFEVYPFYSVNTSAPTPTPALVPPPPGSVTKPKGKDQISAVIIIAIVVPISVLIVLFITGYCFLISRRAKKKYNAIQQENAANDITTVESLQFDLATIEIATNKFSDDNKLGEGGFGVVYKGILSNGQEIAVKRLSKTSGQGKEEFKTEVLLVAKLQHRNLVRLLGFCLQGEEKILVYEFVPNKSLDYFLYEPANQGQLDWSSRYNIIGGIARGLLYLHEDSRLRIIHRDLKASNVLLDEDKNAKISDFGMAKIFGVDQTQGNTSRVVGTYGYMAPEYAMHGQFSVKSDVYSFGVLILEIISGKKISSFYESDGQGDLLSHAWKHWTDGTPLKVLDPNLENSSSRDQVIKCLHIGVLSVQDDPTDRPSMASIVLMLNSQSVSLPSPLRQPAYFLHSRTEQKPLNELESGQSTSKSMPLSVNEASITELYPR